VTVEVIMPRKPYADVKVGDIVRTYELDFEVTRGPVESPQPSAHGGAVVNFIGTYRGPELPDSPMAPFVTKPGDEWTFQRAVPYAFLLVDSETGIHYAP